MYPTILAIHSLVRWFVLISLIYALYIAYTGWMQNKTFTKRDNSIRHWTATIAHVQLIVGVWLYFVSPLVDYFLHNFHEAVHQREIRFFGMEHNFLMLAAIVCITIGSASAKRKQTDQQKFKTMAIWFSIALLIILISIPWSFSFVSPNRPYFRGF